jgi:menaquinol-cytochrome c reductase iron-sulfur subunit
MRTTMKQQTVNIQPDEAHRRSFLAKGIYTLTSLIAATLAASVGTYLGGTPKASEDAWADGGDIAELSPGAPQQITFERSRTDGWKVRNEKATAWAVLDNRRTVTAFSPLCTHLGCAYRWEAQKESFVCPCHGSRFSENGQVLIGPAERPLDRYLVKIEGDRLWLGPIMASRES